MSNKVIYDLVKTANSLDDMGLHNEAGVVDSIIQTFAKQASRDSLLKKSYEDKYDKIAAIVDRCLSTNDESSHRLSRSSSKGGCRANSDPEIIKMEVYSGLGIHMDARSMLKESSFIEEVIADVLEERGITKKASRIKVAQNSETEFDGSDEMTDDQSMTDEQWEKFNSSMKDIARAAKDKVDFEYADYINY